MLEGKNKHIPYSYTVYDKRTKIVDKEVIFYEFEKEPDRKIDITFFRNLLEGQLKPEVVKKFPDKESKN